MLIDHETAKNLELVRNALSYKSNQSLFGKCFSVFGLISLPMLTFRSNGRTAQSNFYKDGCTSVEKYNPQVSFLHFALDPSHHDLLTGPPS
jgi:hypothetical protein